MPALDDVEEGQQPHGGVVDDLGFEGLEALGAGAARVDRGRHAVAERVVVGIEAQRRALHVEVRVDVDEAGRDVVVADVDGLARQPSGR
jgi:hypothetical protein